jgi:hypothetical protein
LLYYDVNVVDVFPATKSDAFVVKIGRVCGNMTTIWNNFDKIISITKLKLENPKWGPVKMANMVHTEKPVTLNLTLTHNRKSLTLTVHDLVFSKYYTFHSLISMVL